MRMSFVKLDQTFVIFVLNRGGGGGKMCHIFIKKGVACKSFRYN
jgi:hypothetical protein